MKALKRLEHALPSEASPLDKAYGEGRLRIAFEFRAKAGVNTDCPRVIAVGYHKRESFNARAISNGQPFNFGDGFGREQQVVFVGNVELVKVVELAPFVLEGLYRVEDVIKNSVFGDGSSAFLSIDGTYRVCAFVEERKCRPSVGGASVCFNERNVSVVEATPQVMDCIASDSWRVEGDGGADVRHAFPRLLVAIGAHSFHVRRDVGALDAFELTDVMFGPFYF